MTERDLPTALASISPAERAVFHTLAYFEIFSYPLTTMELWAFCATRSTEEIVRAAVCEWVESGLAFQFGPYIQLSNDPSWVERRLDYNRRASEFLPTARRMARFIGAFPFIRGVFVSGSLSKHCMAPDGDVDFFILTTPGRLWLARSILVFFKKIFLFNSHKYFCINYFLDTDHLEIEEKNHFTATETVTMLPMYGQAEYVRFCQANNWAWAMLPNFRPRLTDNVPQSSSPFLKKLLERLLSGRLGEWLDVRAMRLTVKYWRRKFHHFSSDKFDAALKSRRHVSKHHPLHFQERVLRAWEARINL